MFQVEGNEAVHAQQLGEEAAHLLGVDHRQMQFRAARLGGPPAAITVDEAGAITIEFDPAVMGRMDSARQLKVAAAEMQHSKQFNALTREMGDARAAAAEWNRTAEAYNSLREGHLDIDRLPSGVKPLLERYFRNEIDAELTAYRSLRGQGIWSHRMATDSRGYVGRYEGFLDRIGAKP